MTNLNTPASEVYDLLKNDQIIFVSNKYNEAYMIEVKDAKEQIVTGLSEDDNDNIEEFISKKDLIEEFNLSGVITLKKGL